jgi:hypothetical protein
MIEKDVVILSALRFLVKHIPAPDDLATERKYILQDIDVLLENVDIEVD